MKASILCVRVCGKSIVVWVLMTTRSRVARASQVPRPNLLSSQSGNLTRLELVRFPASLALGSGLGNLTRLELAGWRGFSLATDATPSSTLLCSVLLGHENTRVGRDTKLCRDTISCSGTLKHRG